MSAAPMPKSIKVGAHVYTILRKPKSQFEEEGLCVSDKLEITIRQRLKRSKAQEVLVHELIHAAGYPSFWDKWPGEEKFVVAVSPVLLQVLQDNPDLVAYLTER